MVIWLFNPYGPIPGEGWRDYCFTILGKALAAAGHDVTWWTSNFSHHFKKFRSAGWKDLPVSERFVVRLVPTTSYRRNIGPGRVLRDAVFAWRAYRRGRGEPRPDCVLWSESPLTFGFAGQRLAEHHRCASVFHQMDLWPELIVKACPARLQPLAEAAFLPVYWNRRRNFRRLDAATGLATPYLEAVLAEAPALRSAPTAVVYNGIDVGSFRRSMDDPLDGVDLPAKAPGELWAVFAGSLGPSYDIATLWRAAQAFSDAGDAIRVLVAGDGPLRAEVEARARAIPRLHFLGKLPPRSLAPLYRRCDVGLCAYSARSNVEMPDKFYDYAAAGLPVVNSLPGEVATLVRDRRLGLPYVAGDVDDLVARLRTLQREPELRAMMAANAWDAGGAFDQHVQCAKLVGVVEAACLGTRGVPTPRA